jgi:hypothetical protein
MKMDVLAAFDGKAKFWFGEESTLKQTAVNVSEDSFAVPA